MIDENTQHVVNELDTLIKRQQSFTREPADIRVVANDTRILAKAMQVLLLAASSSSGECRRLTPYSPLRPVIDAQGKFMWCCNHDPEHCSG